VSPPHVARLAATLAVLAAPLAGQLPRTTPERTNYQRTSTVADVGAFLDSLQRSGAPLVVTEMGKSAGGRPNYLVIVSDPTVTSPGEAAAAGKLVVYLQANIHGGEVEGKEAVQALLRELAGPRHALLDKLVILVAPVYNADGNDALGPQAQNRSEQNGPDPIGQRYDGLNLDLNRDYFKVEAPETRASLERVYDRWDPAVMMDLHTTDGTRHGWLLTYAPPLDPNGPTGPTAWVRDQLLPAVRKTLQDKYQEPIFDYGDTDDPLKPTRWETYAPLGWYGTNYVGLRGRMAILSEAYSHADFEKRIRVTHDFVAEILDYVAAHADDVRRVERDADRQTTLEGAGAVPRPDLAVAYEMASRGTESVPLVVMRANPDTSARPRVLPTDTVRTVALPVFDRFRATKTRPLPAGYYLPPGENAIAELLRLHGLLVERLDVDWSDSVQVFGVKEEQWADRPFQGHKLLALTGDYAPTVVRTLRAGTYFVPTAQPLGRLAFSLLEPEGYGLPRWNLFDRLLGADFGAYAGLVYGSTAVAEFPVWRAVRAPRAPLTALP
jgi:hypothetical protein